MLFFRQLGRNKAFSLIALSGLTAAITVCLLVAQFVRFEQSFESFNPNGSRTYRVNLYNSHNGVFDNISPETVPGLAYSMRSAIPGIESIARIGLRKQGIVANKLNQFEDREDLILFADPSIFDILAVEFIDGNPKQALQAPQTIVVSESIARKYFGGTAVVGKILEIGFSSAAIETKPYEIQGVFRDLPPNTHARFDFILPPENEQAWNENWSWSEVSTYVTLSMGIKPSNLEAALAGVVKEHHQDGEGDRYLLEPITDIRLHALDGNGRFGVVKFFVLLAIIILLLAWFNYINLSTARFVERMKEVGIRKLIGASRRQLVLQFLTEAFFFNIISFSCAVILFLFTWPFVNQFLGQHVPLTVFREPAMYSCMLGFILVGTLGSGIYPALFLSSFKPLQSLKGKVTGLIDRSWMRKAIVVVQLTVSILLITAVLAIRRQVTFMREQNLGITTEQTLIVEGPLLTDGTSVEKFETFKNEMLRLKDVSGVTYASSFPGAEIDWHRTDITLGQENADFRYDSRIVSIGTEFLDVFKVPLLAGRNFDPGLESDKKAMLLSEAASAMFGFPTYADALGKLVFIGSRRFEVIGVIKNYHYRSLQHKIQPLLYIEGYPRNPSYAIRLSPSTATDVLASISTAWKKAYAGNVFKYYFLDKVFDNQYKEDEQAADIVFALTVICILISCSGLFGLSIYSAGRRTREIGIRKVLGATASNVMLLLSRDFLKLAIAGSVIAVPVVYQILNRWLERYAFKMTLDAWLFIVPVMVVLLLVWITISFQTLRAARQNPVESMKYE